LTEVSREPRQIVGFDVAMDKSPERIQSMVDNAPSGERYYSDGYLGYTNIIYPGKYTQNIHNKNDTFTVEGVNSDLRHYIPVLDPVHIKNLQFEEKYAIIWLWN